MLWGKIEERKKAGNHWELNSGHLDCAASAQPLSYENRTTTSTYNPQYILYSWNWNASVAHQLATQYVLAVTTLLEIDWKILSIWREPMLSGFLSLRTLASRWNKES